MPPRLKRSLWIAGAVVAFIACIAPFLPLPFLRPSVERALAWRLGRRVDIDEVSLSVLAGPGFSLSGVTLHEDPRAGIEPFVYAQTVEARVDLLGLLAGRRGFSSLRFSDATLNLVRTSAGEWNFQYLAAAGLSDPPALHFRGARVNLKLGQTKSVLYFDDADLDISPGNQASLDVNFSGAPARTDRSAQNLGHLFVRGSWNPSSAEKPLSLRVESEPNSLDDIAKLFGSPWFDLQGQVSLNAQLTGRPSQLAITGEFQLDAGRRSDFLPSRDGKWDLPIRGTLDLVAEKLELENLAGPANADAKPAPVAARLEADGLLLAPSWNASLDFNDAPLAAMIEVARRIGAPLPEKFSGEGAASGKLRYAADFGLTGALDIRAAAGALAESNTVRADLLPIKIDAQTIVVGPCTILFAEKTPAEKASSEKSPRDAAAENQTAEIQGSYKFDGSLAADFRISTRALNVDLVRVFAPAPLLVQSTVDSSARGRTAIDREIKAAWRGALRYRRSGTEPGVWSGDYSIENARLAIDGLADPVQIVSANVSAAPGSLTVTKMRAKAGDIPFTGDYRWDAAAASPHQFKLRIGEATAAEIDRLLKPSLIRSGGFIERTLRIGTSPAPDWLAQRKVEGTISIAAMIAGDRKLAVDSGHVLWDGPSLQILAIDGRLLDTSVEGLALSAAGPTPSLKGDLTVDLSEAAPQYRLTGKIAGVPYKGGRLDFDGRLEASGDGPPLLASMHATGMLNGRSIAFSPDADFRNVAGGFEASMQGASPRWKFSDLEVTLGSDVYVGEGAAEADGKVILDLTHRGKPVRYTGSLVTLAPQP